MDESTVLEKLQSVVLHGGICVGDEQRRALHNFDQCRTPKKGSRILHCDHCNTRVIYHNACNKRGCPKCHQKNQLIWLERAQTRILPTSHLHIVFSIPTELTSEWLRDRRQVMKNLFKSADAVMKELEETSGLLLGRLQVFQSHGRGLSYKPHIHSLVTDGGMDSEGNWKWLGKLDLDNMVRTFEREYRKLSGQTKEPIEGWSIYVARHDGTGKKVLGYMSRTMAGVVIRFGDGLVLDETKETITVEDRHEGSRANTTLSMGTFVERYLNHIPPERAVTVRYYGLYSNRHRNELEEARKQFESESDRAREDSKEFEECCPNCHKRMRVLAEIEPGKEISYTTWGYTRGPPGHGENWKVA